MLELTARGPAAGGTGRRRKGTVMAGVNGSDARTVVAVIGAGIMGSAMARNLAAAGLDVRVWDRSAPATGPRADAGVVVAASARDVEGQLSAAAIGLACAAALSFGVSIYATGRVSQELSIAWALLPARVVGVACVTLPLAVARRLPAPRKATLVVIATGLAEVGGFASYAVGARHGIAIAAVLASQFAALSALGALVFYRERLTRVQVLGIVVIACAVAALSALRA